MNEKRCNLLLKCYLLLQPEDYDTFLSAVIDGKVKPFYLICDPEEVHS